MITSNLRHSSSDVGSAEASASPNSREAEAGGAGFLGASRRMTSGSERKYCRWIDLSRP